ncbi:MAG TPA: hypothetical protein VM307_02525 [Egibacteraceae bacterium]|nr:hypothetical protein [Egibacteraceae bacterium]
MRLVDAPTLHRLLPMTDAIDVLHQAFADPGDVHSPQRSVHEAAGGALLLMPAWDDARAGVKLVTVEQRRRDRGLPSIHGVYVLFDGDLIPQVVIDGAALTALRTAAVSGVATRLMAPADAHRLIVFGAGVQGEAHVEAMRAVRDITDVIVVSRTAASAAGLVDRLRGTGVAVRAGEPGDVATADVVCTCTTSEAPVFDGAALRPGAHVNAVGAYQPDTREVDDATMRRAAVVVEDRTAAFAEAGDVVIPMAEGILGGDDVVELGEVVRGAAVRPPSGGVTVFKSVGVAFEDLAVAAAVAARL